MTSSPQRRSTDRPRTAWQRRWTLIVAILTSVLIAATFGGDVLVLSKLSRQSAEACSTALVVRDAMVDILVDAQDRSESNPPQTLTEQERRRAADFYDASIRRMRVVECQR